MDSDRKDERGVFSTIDELADAAAPSAGPAAPLALSMSEPAPPPLPLAPAPVS